MQLFGSMTDSDFLAFYIALLAFAGVAGWWIPRLLREPGRSASLDDLESIAVLTGGPSRLTDSLLAELFVKGAVSEGEKGKLAIADRDAPVSPAARKLLATDAPLSLADAKSRLRAHAEQVAARLQRAGLLMRDSERARLRWLSITPFVAVFLIGLYRQRAGDALGEPTGFLVSLLMLTVIFAVIRFASVDPRTAAGIAAVRDLQVKYDRHLRAPMPEEAGLAVALFGTTVLVGTPWEPVHAMRKAEGDGGSGSGDGGGGDGGSGCGGGCGGCGG